MQRLDPLYTPLTDFNLIEASAGTGKTYTITALYLRLVVEARIPVNRILVVTYTNAATKELRDRIRSRLAEIRHAFLDGRADKDDELGARLLDLTPDREHAIRRLSNALRGFDEAAIFTIHGFCKRVLGDNAFESGLSFDTELLADTGELLREVVEDFWRREFYPGPPIVVQYFLDQGASPETLLRQIEPHLGKPYLHIVTPNSAADGPTLEKAFNVAFQQARDLWRQDRPAIEELLLTSPALNRQKYNPKSIPGWLEAMGIYLSADPPRLAKFDKFAQFTTTKLRASLRKDQTVPHHAFFDACETLNAACDALADYCRYQIPVKLLAYCNAELTVRKRREQVQSYDDLLLDLHAALQQSRRGPALVKTLQERYAAALIDEFQDTDPVQYEIFHRIYAGTGQPVFLVGDPKQAIYSFRGADIFAYLTARRDTPRQHTLDVNWRSDPRLLAALNALFGAVKDQPFLFDGIPFHDAIAAPRPQREPLLIQGRREPPLQLWLLAADGAGPINKGFASEQAVQATAAEIARLLNLGARGQAQLGDRPLAGGDIAVLVRSHWQGRLMRRQLLQLNVPSVQHADDSVFLADEARQLEWLLAAVAEPGHEGRVRTALASDLFGLTGEELHRLREEEQSWARWLEKFQDYRLLWQEQGFMRFFRAWLIQEGVPQRLLSFRDGDRRLTNLLHLAELVHLASRAHPGMAGVLKWLGDCRRLPSNKDEEQQLRLESDENLVRIVTVHKSKGLEYDVVFCPFLWDGRLRAGENGAALLYHDPADLRRSILAIGAGEEDPAVQLARREEMAESLRLFYVALTRAKQRCYLVWGKVKDADTAPAAWLLHHPAAVGPAQDPLEVTQQRFNQITPAAFLEDLQAAFAAAGDAVALTPIPQAAGDRYQPSATAEPELQARGFSRSLAEFWRVGSFTSLTSGLSVEAPDYDMTVTAPATLETAPVGLNVFTFPRGARAGACLHAIFERLDFSRSDRTLLEDRVRRTLTGHGLDAEIWTPTVADWVERVLATPLNGNGLRLETVTLERRISELEFYYPVARLRDEALRRLLERYGYAADPFRNMIDRLEFNPLRGYMKGFIDLVFEADGRFYLVDYKSNWLGPERAAYRPERLAEAMARETYVLQYLIYAVALHRYLRLRVADYHYETHFGGVFYLFLRGMDPALGADCGVFHDRPAPEFITALDSIMAKGR